MRSRTETDSLGAVKVPGDAYWGAQTARALENYPISGMRMPPAFVVAYARVKRAAAEVNGELGVVDPQAARAIAAAALEIESGKLADQFPVDVYQAGAGTSFHMNVNEVLANRALELLGRRRGDRKRLSPNDHVNAGQSTNDTFPTALRIAALELHGPLRKSLTGLSEAFRKQAAGLGDALKAGRTHLQDAVPMRIAQEVGGWASAVEAARDRLDEAARPLHDLPLGGTAVGTGMNAHPEFPEAVCARLAKIARLPLRAAPDRFARIASMADFLHYSAALRGAAVEIGKIASDVRLLASGPFTGLGEVLLPAVQPGSSIMPGKVNPSIAEMTGQVCHQVVGLDAAIASCAAGGQLELNVMTPVAGWDLLHASTILSNAVRTFARRCVSGMRWDLDRARRHLEASAGMATILNPHIGYLAAAEVAKQAVAQGRTVLDVIRERGLLPEETLAAILDPRALTEPGRSGARPVQAEPGPRARRASRRGKRRR